MTDKKVPSVYSMLDFKNPEELYSKAVVATEISMIYHSHALKVSEAASLLEIPEEEMLSLLKGHFEEYQLSELEAYATILRSKTTKTD